MSNSYQKLNQFWKNKFGTRTLKICVDGGFSCPNRDGKCGYGGCIFCGERGAGEHLKRLSISDQVSNHLDSYRGERADKFIVYFQNFSNTYAPIEILKQKYDSALIDDRIIGIAIATRPDCITEEIVQLLASYKDQYYVMVELGLQTANDKIGQTINRGYTTQDFIQAVELLHQYNIDVVAHVMIGLPGETEQDIENITRRLNQLQIDGIKIHSTYIVENTKLHTMYQKGEYQPITIEYYIQQVIYILTHLDPSIVVHRITGDAPKNNLIAPDWTKHKKRVLNAVEKIMKDNGFSQGMYTN